MAVTVFAVPILPGKTEQWKRAVAEMKGARKAEYEESRRRMGVEREVVSLEHTPDGDFVVVFLEGQDPAGMVGRYMHSDRPFDRWFAETILTGTHGQDASQAPPPANEIFLNWSA